MKKFILLAIAAIASFGAFAQDNEYATEKGDFSTEIQFNPFNSDYTFKLDALKFRYFVGDKDALTFEFGIDAVNRKNIPNTDEDNVYTSNHNGSFRIGLGYERYFFNYKRINLYAGANLYYVHKFAGSKSINGKYGTEYIGYDNVDDKYQSNGFGAGIFTGIDFSIYKGLYCGAELGFRIQDDIICGYKVKELGTTDKEIKHKQGGHDFSISTKVQPLIRLGWRF